MATEASITLEDFQNGKIVHLSGEMDETNLPELEQAIAPLAEDATVKNVIFDFNGLEFINSKVIGYFASVYSTTKRVGHELIFANANETIMDILALVGLTEIVPNFNTLEEAINSTNA